MRLDSRRFRLHCRRIFREARGRDCLHRCCNRRRHRARRCRVSRLFLRLIIGRHHHRHRLSFRLVSGLGVCETVRRIGDHDVHLFGRRDRLVLRVFLPLVDSRVGRRNGRHRGRDRGRCIHTFLTDHHLLVLVAVPVDYYVRVLFHDHLVIRGFGRLVVDRFVLIAGIIRGLADTVRRGRRRQGAATWWPSTGKSLGRLIYQIGLFQGDGWRGHGFVPGSGGGLRRRRRPVHALDRLHLRGDARAFARGKFQLRLSRLIVRFRRWWERRVELRILKHRPFLRLSVELLSGLDEAHDLVFLRQRWGEHHRVRFRFLIVERARVVAGRYRLNPVLIPVVEGPVPKVARPHQFRRFRPRAPGEVVPVRGNVLVTRSREFRPVHEFQELLRYLGACFLRGHAEDEDVPFGGRLGRVRIQPILNPVQHGRHVIEGRIVLQGIAASKRRPLVVIHSEREHARFALILAWKRKKKKRSLARGGRIKLFKIALSKL